MKKRKNLNLYLICALLTSVIFSVGASMWLLVQESGFVLAPNEIQVPQVMFPTFNAIYEGEDLSFSYAGSAATSGNFYVKENEDLTLLSEYVPLYGVQSESTTTFTLNMVFVPSNPNTHVKVEGEATLTMYAVARIDSNYYGTVDKALAVANAASSGTVTVIPIEAGATDSNKVSLESRAQVAKTISTTTVINEGVVLSLPWIHSTNGETVFTNDTTNYSDLLNTGRKKGTDNFSYKKNSTTPLRNNLVYLSRNLTNKGTILIGGQIDGAGGGYSASYTGGNYAEIKLKKNVYLTNSGTIEAYGYITEEEDSSDANATPITLNSGSQLITPFFVYEHRGGNVFAAMANPIINVSIDSWDAASEAFKNKDLSKANVTTITNLQTFPFNRFFLPNVMPKITINYGASVVGKADLYANSAHNVSQMELIGTTANCLIQLSSGSKIVSKYNPDNSKTTMNIIGNFNLRPLALTLTLTAKGAKVVLNLTTAGLYLPLSEYYDVTLSPGTSGTSTVNLSNQDIKIMPGSSLTVERGVSVTAGNVVIHSQIYQDNEFKYSEDLPAGNLIVNGTFNAAAIGGVVRSSESGGKVFASEQNSVTFTEYSNSVKENVTLTVNVSAFGFSGLESLVQDSLPKITENVAYHEDQVETFKFYRYIDGIVEADPSTAEAAKQYESVKPVGADQAGWFTTSANITYVLNNGGGTQTVPVSVSGGYNPYSYNVQYPHYSFTGWYLDENLTNRVEEGTLLYADATLYAGWQMINYQVNYSVSCENEEVLNASNQSVGNLTEFNVLTNSGLTLNPVVVNTAGWKFDGWYLDNAFTNKVSNNVLSVNLFTSGATQITLYARIVTEDKASIEFVLPNGSTITKEAIKNNVIDSYPDNEANLLINGDNRLSYMLEQSDGAVIWYVDSSCTNAYDKNTLVTGAMILYAKQGEAKPITVKYTNEGVQVGELEYYVSGATATLRSGAGVTKANGASGLDGEDVVTYNTYSFKQWTIPSGVTENAGNLTLPAVGNATTLEFVADYTTTTVYTYYKVAVEEISNATVELTGTTYTYANITANAAGTGTPQTFTVKGYAYVRAGSRVVIKLTKTEDEWESSTSVKMGTGDPETLTEIENDRTCTINEVTASITIKANSKACIAAGTLITLVDGSQKKVEDLLETDVLLVFDHETGKYVAAPILFIERDGWANYNVINLEFSNGTKTKLIYEHALFDLTLNKYVYITESNYSDYVGHKFAVMNAQQSGYDTVTLTKAYVATEYTGCYSLVTAYHLNYFIDGLFSIPGGITGLFNYFEYDKDLKYDEEKMQADIAKYGLYTYEDFKDYVSYEVFEYAFAAKYFKVSVGKGLMTYEDILALIERYVKGHDLN